jgi:hypothetical protein
MKRLLPATVAAVALSVSMAHAAECNDPDVEKNIQELYNKTPPFEPRIIDLENEGRTPEVRSAAEGTVIMSCQAVALLSNGNRVHILYGEEQHANGRFFYGYQILPISQRSYAPPAPSVYRQPVPTPTPPPSAALSPMFQKGLTDRAGWENWYGSLSGDVQVGAYYWAGQRSLSYPGPCEGSPMFISGCQRAKELLTPTDVLRNSYPDYKIGWKSYGH